MHMRYVSQTITGYSLLSIVFMKLFRTNNIDVINYCHTQFNFALPSVLIEQCSRKFVVKYRLCDNVFCMTSFC